MGYRVGIDIGGTFTDFVVMRDGRVALTWKEESTPEDSMEAVCVGLEAIARELGPGLAALLGDTSALVHGTTTSTNTVIQRNGPRVGLVCTEGFSDVLYFRDGFKPDRFNIHLQHPKPFVDRALRIDVRERLDVHGEVVVPLDEDAVRAAGARFREARVEAVAVALLWAPVNRAHERRAAEILREEMPGVPVVEAAEVLPEIREWERTSAAVLSAYVLPDISGYLGRFERWLQTAGLRRQPLIMQINGGCASVEEILRRPVNSLASGPAAASSAAMHAAGGGADDLITIDMGGTSFDVCLITGGRPALTRTMQIEGQPLGVMGVAVHSIGAGGGSVAWVDRGGAIRVGPRSAGARPGPACYGLGGTRATLTDAYVVLGYLSPTAFLGGRRVLREDLALEAVERDVAEPLGLDAVQAAAGIERVTDSKMVRAVQAVSVRRGIDPRGYTLVAGGGAGGLHVVRLARELGLEHVLVPAEAAVLCALGMTVTDVRHDYVRAMRMASTDIDLARINAVFNEMEDEGRRRLRAEGFDDARIQMERWVDACYRGQIYELNVPVPSAFPLKGSHLEDAIAAFNARHEALFGYRRHDLPVDFLHWRLVVRGRDASARRNGAATPRGRGPAGPAAPAEPVDQRLVHFLEFGGWILTNVYAAEGLAAGAEIHGPAIVQSQSTTLLLCPGDRAVLRPDGVFAIRVAVEPGASASKLGGVLRAEGR
jgi:N-methylhydantoinase A